MGLIHPVDLAAWRAGQRKRLSLPRSKQPEPELWIATNQDGPVDVVVALESRAPSSLLTFLPPLLFLDVPIAVYSSVPIDPDWLPGWQVHRAPRVAEHPNARVVFFAGNYLPVGAAVLVAAPNAHVIVSQHGLLTPFAPPLPTGAHLLAFSEADVEFWCSGREDVTGVAVGSQLLHQARDTAATPADGPPVFLGQFHGQELAKTTMARTALSFCRRNQASYRPHPAERDRRSSIFHRVLSVSGVHVDTQPGSIPTLAKPVVGMFSTGVLEAAAMGLPAWVYCRNPPNWLEEFWDRYELSHWGQPPTAAPSWLPETEPAQMTADVIRAKL